MLDPHFDPRERGGQIQRWVPADRPFVRIDTPEGEVHHGRATAWCGSWVQVYLSGPTVFDGRGYWVTREWVTREPGRLPEYRVYWSTGDSLAVRWEPSTCPWPRPDAGRGF
ncbi:hypothetical protein [Zhihengliuella sp.]|uniref:hypothetical protein n=1 Tax=Zhihengliuella sp. TaxID=1954483 RepID=UPI0028124B86|nr:hypothetical protein [Zhihengliuella sp.]